MARRRGQRLRAVLGVLALVLTVSACGLDWGEGRENPEDIVAPAGFDGRSFESAEVTGHTLAPGSTLALTFEDGVMMVQAGCNSMRAGYEQDGDVLRWTGPAASTMMACDPALMDQDQWAAGLFTDGMTVVDGDADLTLESGDVRISFDEVDTPGGTE